MVLTFLVILAFLAYSIVGELERGQDSAASAMGSCPRCAQTVEPDWLLCPGCRILLKEACKDCGRHHAILHAFCPWCGMERKRQTT